MGGRRTIATTDAWSVDGKGGKSVILPLGCTTNAAIVIRGRFSPGPNPPVGSGNDAQSEEERKEKARVNSSEYRERRKVSILTPMGIIMK